MIVYRFCTKVFTPGKRGYFFGKNTVCVKKVIRKFGLKDQGHFLTDDQISKVLKIIIWFSIIWTPPSWYEFRKIILMNIKPKYDEFNLFWYVFHRFWKNLTSPEISGKLRKTQTLCFLHRGQKLSGDFRRRSVSSLGHQKMMKSEDVKIGNIIISQSRCHLGCGKVWMANSQYPGRYLRWRQFFYIK